LYRGLAQGNFAEFGPGLARVRHNNSNPHAGAGRGTEAVTAIEEAVDLGRRLVDVDPREHEEDLARALSTLASRLSAVGRREQALQAAQQAARIYESQKPRFSADYAVALNNLAVLFGDLGRRAEAFSTIDESFEIQRRPGHDRATALSQIRDQSERIKVWLMDLLP
jgi:tetratricopeptide (TPR) repeat protein